MDFMTRLEMVLMLILLVSFAINVLLFVYSRNVAQKLVLISSEIDDMRAAAASFASHVKQVYELEMFYGDQTLQALMDHARSFREYMDEFDFIYIPDEEEELQADAKTKQIEEI
jgi:hypothetical protein